MKPVWAVMARHFLTCLVCGIIASALVWFAARVMVERFCGPPSRATIDMGEILPALSPRLIIVLPR